jgi:copper chaperone
MKKTLKVKGMHCKSCDILVEDSLSDLEGLQNSKSNHQEDFVEVEFDESKVNIDQIKKVIIDEGYEVE